MTRLHVCDKCKKVVERNYNLHYIKDGLDACDECYKKLNKLIYKWMKNGTD